MSTRLVAAAALYAVFLGAWSAARGLRGVPPGGILPLGLVLLESVQLLQAGVVVVALLSAASEVAESTIFGGYLFASVLLIPLAAAYDRGTSGWDSLTLTIGLLGLAVVDRRLTELWVAPT